MDTPDDDSSFVSMDDSAYLSTKRELESQRDFYLREGDYKKVIEYNDLLLKEEEELNRNAIKEMELKSKSDTKKLEYKQLKMNHDYNEKRNKLLLTIFILLCLGCLILMLLISSRRINIKRRIALINAEKEETKLKLKLKEEQAVKLELQKYEILSDSFLKEMELNGKIKDFEQLRQEMASLNAKVENYRQSIELFETSIEKSSVENKEIQNELINELIPQIKKYLPDSQEYIKNIEQLGDSFIENVVTIIDSNMSKQYLKYCICFAIGMSIKEVSDCWFIEQSSVHMVRYRLKKKFSLGNDGDIDLFLKKLAL